MGEDSLQGDEGIGPDISLKRSPEATSKKTLNDLEEEESVPESRSSEDESASSSTPSPDGAPDQTRGKSNDIGPM
jgi:hypothetical protein